MATPLLLRRADQVVIAVLVVVWLLGATFWWVRSGGLQGELIEIDNAPPLDYQFLVDLNRAAWPELAQLPGIGKTLAQRIVVSRHDAGAFRSIEELTRVDGVGPRKLEAVRRYLLPMALDQQVANSLP